MLEEVKEGMKTVSHQIDNIIKMIGMIKREPNRNSGVVKHLHKMRNSVEKLSSRLKPAKESTLALLQIDRDYAFQRKERKKDEEK